MMTPSGGRGGLHSEINVTPLVDVVLVLLIIFMVIVPLTLHGYDLDIPTRADPADLQPDQEPVVLAIDAASCPLVEVSRAPGLPSDCRVRLGGDLVPVTTLEQRVREIFSPRAADDRVLYLDVEERLNYEGVMRVTDLARAGAPGLRIGMVVEPETP